MTGSTSSRTFDRLVADRVAKARAARLGAFNDLSIQWLIVSPEWSDDLALACGFPTGEEPLPRFVERASLARLCERYERHTESWEHDVDDREPVRFWMPAHVRTSLLNDKSAVERRRLLQTAETVASHIRDARDRGVDVSRGVSCWADLAGDELASLATGASLLRQVDACMREGRAEDAMDWLAAAEVLEPLLGAPMQAPIERAKVRLNLRFRALRDSRELDRFLERPSQIDALEQLVCNHGDVWALHLHGMAGVGKTMLLRYLMGPFAQRHEGLVAARIDFDHLDPRYPTERPGRLLEELAEGLSPSAATGPQDKFLRSLRSAIDRANVVAMDREPGADPLGTLRSPAFQQAIEAFAAFVNTFPGMTVLILDTCEELAKLHPAAESVPSIDATFEILERVRALAPRTVAIFAGRRLLAPVDADGAVATGSEPVTTMSLQPRTYLRRHRIQGFTREEVERYLSEVRKVPLEPAFVEAILAHSPDAGGSGKDRTSRYNPYDVAAHVDWLTGRADGDSGLDSYLHVRILAPLADEPHVRAVLPAVALLGKFDSATIAAVLPDDRQTRRRTILTLAEQEWIQLHNASDLDAIVMEVEPGLLPRLKDYYELDGNTVERDAARSALRPSLRAALLETPLKRLTFEQVQAALNVLEADEAAESWTALADRVAAAQAWPWADSLCSRLLAVDVDDIVPGRLLAGVRALYAAALLHRGAAFDPRSLWVAVETDASRFPGRRMASTLKARAQLNLLTCAVRANEEITQKRMNEVLRACRKADRHATAGARIALLEALVESGANGVATIRVGVIEQLVRFVDTSEVSAYGQMLVGRYWFSHRSPSEKRKAARYFDEACAHAPAGPVTQRWHDWIAPASVRQRVHLERLRHNLALRTDTRRFLRQCEKAAFEAPASIDADRLLSLVIQTHLAYGVIPGDVVDVFLHHQAASQPRRGTAPIHGCVPPLFCSVGDALLAVGRGRDALRFLASQEGALALAGEEELSREASIAFLRSVRRMRLRERMGQVRALCTSDQADVRREALATAALVEGTIPDAPLREVHEHARWRATDLLDPEVIPAASEPLRAFDRLTDADVLLDLVEESYVLRRLTSRRPLTPKQSQQLVDQARAAVLQQPAADANDPLGWTTTALPWRAIALEVLPAEKAFRPLPRAAGLAALEEGALLGLRSPKHAAKLLDIAMTLLADANDPVAEFQAAVCRALARIHADEREAVVKAAALPGLLQRAQMVSDELAAATTEDLYGPWRGWLDRFEATQRWLTLGRRSAVQRIGARPGREPSELTVTSVPQGPGWWAARVPAWLTLFLGPVLLGIGASTLPAFWVANSLGAGTVASLLISAFALLTLVGGLSRRWRPRMLRFVFGKLAVDLAILETDTAPFVLMRLGGRTPLAARYANWTMSWVPRLLRGGTDRLPPFTANWVDPEKIPSGLATRLGDRRGRLAPPLRLAVTPGIAPTPWEALLIADAAPADGSWSPAEASAIWRRSPWRRRAVRTSPGWRKGIVALIGSDGWTGLLEQWTMIDGFHAIRPALGPSVAGPDARAVLVVGSPIATGSGWRISTGDGVPGRAKDQSKRPSGALLAPDIAPRSTPIVVMADVPADGALTSDPHSAGGLRGFADELFASGAHAVLTIPSLPIELTARLLRELGREIAGWNEPPPTKTLVEVVTRLRTIVFSANGGPNDPAGHEQRVRVAYDICLYAGTPTD